MRWRRVVTPDRVDLRVAGWDLTAASARMLYRPLRRPAGFAQGVFSFTGSAVCGRPAEPPINDVAVVIEALCSGATAVAALRSMSADRWTFAFSRNGTPLLFAKVGDVDSGALRREGAALAAMAGRELGVRCPSVRFAGELGPHFVLATLPLGRRPRRMMSLDAVSRMLRGLSRPADGGAPWVHGDVVPWNLSWANGAPGLIDWEYAEPRRAPLWDLAHYVTQTGRSLSVWDPGTAVRTLTAAGEVGWRHLRDLGEDPWSARASLLAYINEAAARRIDEGSRRYLTAMRATLQQSVR